MSKLSQFYKDYLRSPAWKRKQQAVLKRDNYLCQACRNDVATEVHHKTYIHLGNEPLFDLESVCKGCHAFLTMLSRRRVKTTCIEQEIERLLLSD